MSYFFVLSFNKNDINKQETSESLKSAYLNNTLIGITERKDFVNFWFVDDDISIEKNYTIMKKLQDKQFVETKEQLKNLMNLILPEKKTQMPYAKEALLKGETVINKEPGSSMLPILKSRQAVRLAPITWEDCEKGDIVYCKVGRHYYTHLVKAKDIKRGLLIGNNHGHDNGWTKKVYGKVIEILED